MLGRIAVLAVLLHLASSQDFECFLVGYMPPGFSLKQYFYYRNSCPLYDSAWSAPRDSKLSDAVNGCPTGSCYILTATSSDILSANPAAGDCSTLTIAAGHQVIEQ